MITFRASLLAWGLFVACFFAACATEEFDEIEEQMSQESEQEIQQEEVIEEDTSTDTDMSSEEAMAQTEEVQEVMQEPITETSSEALASELDKLSAPDVGMDQSDESISDNSMSDTSMTDTEDTSVDSSYQEPVYSDPEPTMAATGDQSDYVVQPGDTLGHIAHLVYGSSNRWRELANENSITDPSRIFPGDVIRYQVTDRSKTFADAYSAVEQEVIMVQKGDTLALIAERLFGRADYWKPMWHLNRNEIPNPDHIKEGQVLKYLDPKKLVKVLNDKGLTDYAH